MRLRDVLTATFRDFSDDSMTRAGASLRREGIHVSTVVDSAAGVAVFAEADADAVSTSRMVAGSNLQFLLVLEGSRLLGLIDAEALRALSGPFPERVIP